MPALSISLDDLLAGVREGRLTESTARRWLADQSREVRAAAGSADEEISDEQWAGLFGCPPARDSYVSAAAVIPPVSYPPPRPAVATYGPGPIYAAGPDEMTDEQAARLWPPASAEEADRRAVQAAEATSAAAVEDDDDSEIEARHRSIFGDSAFAPDDAPQAG